MKASVVILNWNGAKYLTQFLPILQQHTTLPDVELVVADNASTDNSLDVLRSFPAIRVLTFDKNYGFAEGYNRALAQLDADYFVLLNSDVEVTPHWLDTLLTYMDLHPETAACQPKILAYNNRTFFEHAGACGGYIDSWGYPYCRGRLMSYVEEDQGQYDTTCQVFWATGACLLIRSKAYREAGGLDADFFAHMEEIDLCWRLGSRGHKLACVPQSRVYHIGGGSLSAENPFKTYLNFRNNLLMLYKNLPANRLRCVMSMRWLLDNAAALQMLLTGQRKNAQAVWRARHDYHKMRPDFAKKRDENMQFTTTPWPDGMQKRSIVWDFYIRHLRQ